MGSNTLGSNSIALGKLTSPDLSSKNTICINETGEILHSFTENATFMAPIRNVGTNYLQKQIVHMYYSTTNKEIVYTAQNTGLLDIVDLNTGIVAVNQCYGSDIYMTTDGGTLTLPGGLRGMNIYIITRFSPGTAPWQFNPGSLDIGWSTALYHPDIPEYIYYMSCDGYMVYTRLI